MMPPRYEIRTTPGLREALERQGVDYDAMMGDLAAQATREANAKEGTNATQEGQ